MKRPFDIAVKQTARRRRKQSERRTTQVQLEVTRLLETIRCLRNPEAECHWDLRQDFASIAPNTIKEAYEVADAIHRQDINALRGEQGDQLLQVVYHARMAEEEGQLTSLT